MATEGIIKFKPLLQSELRVHLDVMRGVEGREEKTCLNQRNSQLLSKMIKEKVISGIDQ